jgi:L,D-transpeptidase YnhG
MLVFDRKFYFAVFLLLMSVFGVVHSKTQRHERVPPPQNEPVAAKDKGGTAEARLIEIYNLMGSGRSREALSKAAKLTEDVPNFQLAHLVYGDLLNARTRTIRALGNVPIDTVRNPNANTKLAELRNESLQRIKAIRERPAPGTIPSQFLSLSTRNKHAIAIDASRSRLYLFENTTAGLKLVSDYYISVGKAGTVKSVEGDQRTPLGVYYITSNLNPKSLKDLYGSGALPINYPNILDTKRGKTGGGIWLHGTPHDQFSRAPQASDGCIVLTNPDLTRIIRTVEVRTTPVVIASELKWVAPQSLLSESKPFEDALFAWRDFKSTGNFDRVLSFYTADFNSFGKGIEQWTPALKAEVMKAQGRNIQLKDVSYLRWTDSSDTMVVTFGEVADGSKAGVTKRQYWTRQGDQWKIFFEGVI